MMVTYPDVGNRRLVAIANTHRALALTGLRDPLGRLEEQLWGNTFELYTLIGPVDILRLERAIHNVIRRQLAFRSRFVLQSGEDLFGTSAGPYLAMETLRRGSIASEATCDNKHRIRERLSACAREAFHLQNDPLTRVILAEDATDRWRIAIAQDHSISDAWSLKLLSNAIMRKYGELPPRAAPEIIAKPDRFDGSYFDWYEGLGANRVDAKEAQKRWHAVTDAAGSMASRPRIPGGRWLPRAHRRLNREFRYRFSAHDQRQLRERATKLGSGTADLLLASAQLGLLAIAQSHSPLSYIYSGRSEPRTWRTMGLFCEELLTLDVSASNEDSLDTWITNFLQRNHPRSNMGSMSVLDFQSVRSQENAMASFNFLPPRRPVQVSSDIYLEPATGKEYEALEMPEHVSRFGIVMRVWEPEASVLELRMDVDDRMCPRPDRAAHAMLYGALAGGGGHLPLSEALATIRSLWGATAVVETERPHP